MPLWVPIVRVGCGYFLVEDKEHLQWAVELSKPQNLQRIPTIVLAL